MGGSVGVDGGSGVPEGTSTRGFVELVRRLVTRARRGDRPLPLLRITADEGKAVLDALEDRLRDARNPVPHARVPARDEEGRWTGEPGLPGLLSGLCDALPGQRSGADRLRFRHYGLLRWLLRQDLTGEHVDDIPAELARRLREHRHPQREKTAEPGPFGTLGPVHYVLWFLAQRVIPAVLFRAALSERIPGIGRTYRWFAHQRYPGPNPPRAFLTLAERLTTGGRNGGRSSEEIGKLLVHAFLEDLRQAYARPFWSLRGRRRTAYPVALVDGAAPGDGEDAGERLLELVNDVRTETGKWDPLLVVYAGPRPSARIAEAGPDALAGLAFEVPGDSGGNRPVWEGTPRWSPSPDPRTAWYLPVKPPGPADRPGAVRSGTVEAPPPPWYAHRAFAVVLCLALLAPLAGWTGQRLGGPDCLYRPFSGQVSVRDAGDECIGYSDGSAFRFNDQPGQERLQQAQKKIFEQNRKVRENWESSDRRRPYVTVVYLGTLTGRNTNDREEAYAAERQELEGLAVAQYLGIDQPATATDVPLMHVVVANAGFQMRHADQVIDMIADLARGGGEAPVVGVVGLVESRSSTIAALQRLHEVGIPAVAPTLSGERMFRGSPLYLQIAAPNRDQATMAAEYAKSQGIQKTRIYHTVGERSSLSDDIYVSTLVEQLKEKVEGIEYTKSFRGQSLRDECGYPGMLFFAGRWSEFPAFLRTLDNSCEERPRHLVADDSVNRYMANPLLRRSAPAGLPLVFASKAPLATCEKLRSRARQDGDRRAAGKFLQLIMTDKDDRPLERPRCAGSGGAGPEEPVGERVGLAYDSAVLLLDAVESLTTRVRVPDGPWDPRLISPVTIHTEVLRRNGNQPFSGATGRVEFYPDKGEPMGRTISFLRVDDITDTDERPREVFRCEGTGEDDETYCGEPGR